jgi:hypothetical protein
MSARGALLLFFLSSCGPAGTELARDPLPPSTWEIPRVDPCTLLSRAAMEALVGSAVNDLGPGGTAVDGSACEYTGAGPFVVTLGLMSTNAYESLKLDFGGEPVHGVGTSALVDGADPLGDVTLVARSAEAAVLIRISGIVPGAAGRSRRQLAADIARNALEQEVVIGRPS